MAYTDERARAQIMPTYTYYCEYVLRTDDGGMHFEASVVAGGKKYILVGVSRFVYFSCPNYSSPLHPSGKIQCVVVIWCSTKE